MKWKIDLPKFSNLVYYLVKFIGLAPFTVNNDVFYPPTILGKLYLVFIAAAYSIIGSTVIFMMINSIKIVSLIVALWMLFIQLIGISSVVVSLIIFLTMHNKIVYFMNKLRIVSNELKSLGVDEDHGKLFKNLFTTTVMANVAHIAASVIVTLLEPNWPIGFSIYHGIETCFDMNISLMFSQILIYIGRRFTLLNERLLNLLKPAVNYRGSPDQVRIFVASRNDREVIEPGSEELSDFQRLRKIKTLHLELRDLVNRATHVFAIPIILNSIRCVCQFMMGSYWLYYTLRNPNRFTVVSILSTVLRNVTMISLLFSIAHASAITCKQGNFTIAVLYKTWSKSRPAELAEEFLMFSNQLLHTPITVSVNGLVNLDYSLLITIFSTVTAYLIIMIQFEMIPAL